MVRLEVRPGDDGAVLVLEHRRLPARQATGHAAGWQAHLAGLAAQVEDAEVPDWDGCSGGSGPPTGPRTPTCPERAEGTGLPRGRGPVPHAVTGRRRARTLDG